MKKSDGKVADLTVTILKEIRDEMRGMREEMREELGSVRGEIHDLRTETNERFVALESTTARGFEAVTARLEHLRDFAGERWRDHEERIRRLEARAGGR
jgi:hypothetical protein